MEKLLICDHLYKSFGGVKATQDVNFTLDHGEILGVIGPNGAGKTTLFNLLTGVYKIDQGNIILDGESIVGMQPKDITMAGMSRTFQNIRLFKELTALENVMVPYEAQQGYNIFECATHLGGYRKKKKQAMGYAMDMLDVMGISNYADTMPSALSYGHQRKLEIARALVLGSKVLLLDEPTSGMNPVETAETMEAIKTVHSRFKVGILLIEHHMGVAMNLCDNLLVLNFGKQIAYGTPAKVRSDENVIEAYLGRDDDAV